MCITYFLFIMIIVFSSIKKTGKIFFLNIILYAKKAVIIRE